MAQITSVSNYAMVSVDGVSTASNSVLTNLQYPTALVTLVKKADITRASLHDIVEYNCEITNPGAADKTNLLFTDVLPPQVEYVQYTFEIDGASAPEPAINGNTITYTIPSLAAGAMVKLAFEVKVISLN